MNIHHRLVRHGTKTAAALLLLSAAACGGGGSGNSSAGSGGGGTTSESSTSAATTVQTSKTQYGDILVDSKGMTLYMFDPDKQGKSVCDADCLAAWPIVKGPAKAGSGVQASKLGTTQSTDGKTMATYNNWPLYYFVKDKKPGDVAGQGANDVWWVMGPDGKPIRQMASQKQ